MRTVGYRLRRYASQRRAGRCCANARAFLTRRAHPPPRGYARGIRRALASPMRLSPHTAARVERSAWVAIAPLPTFASLSAAPIRSAARPGRYRSLRRALRLSPFGQPPFGRYAKVPAHPPRIICGALRRFMFQILRVGGCERRFQKKAWVGATRIADSVALRAYFSPGWGRNSRSYS